MTHTQAHMWHPTLPTQIDMDVRANKIVIRLHIGMNVQCTFFYIYILTYEKSSYNVTKPKFFVHIHIDLQKI